ncbi:molybdenum cofactor guanylyltransferase MobA [Pseudorhodobacter sp. W20_MBD10_FR17]|uniref:molybdenum cofactor guanylyltransferase MobA n=1 Tax=Pseudorhodobacter sp. W20_MBD10_FR17 TaxID=3240266 RepID=UPI003F994213
MPNLPGVILPGVILAGGRATRMGGGDKGLRVVAGKRLIDHVITRLSAQCSPLAINANGDPARLMEFGLPILADSLPDHPGPLAGVLAGLDWAAGFGASAIITAAADTPFFPENLAAQLVANAGPTGLCLAASADPSDKMQRQPTFGLWPTALRHDLRAALQGGLRKIVLWTDSHNAGSAEFASQPFDPFFNINTPEDIVAAEILMGRA